jgi:hypothetical protein
MNKICKACGASFTKDPHSTYARWEAQRFCSIECGSKSIRLGTQLERLAEWSIPEPNSGCWLWLGHVDRNGYGLIVVDWKRVYAHRLSFSLHKGPIPDGAGVLHHCDMPPCINPEHLYAGTPADNARDRVIRKRTCAGSKNAMSKLNERSVIKIRNGGRTDEEFADEYGVSENTIKRAREGFTWRHT